MRIDGPLARYVAKADHDGFELVLPLRSREEISALAATALTLLLVPASLAVVVFPAAILVEWSGWWLVNEAVLAERWLLIGASIAVLSWLLWPSLLPKTPPARLRVEQRRIVVRRKAGDWSIPTLGLSRVVVTGSGMRLQYLPEIGLEDVIVEIPLDQPSLWKELAQLITDRASEDGASDAIPEAIRSLQGVAARRTPQ